MSRISEVFEKGPVFVGFLTVGDPSLEFTEKAALALEKGGVQLLELGLPFSDPIGEGPVIQEATARSLQKKTTPQHVLQVIRKIRLKSEIPIILMSYYNPLLQGGQKFLSELKKAGADGVIVVDLPLEEAKTHLQWMRELDLDTIFLISPSTSDLRRMQIVSQARGFIYYACQKGTTGVRQSMPKDLKENIQKIKEKTSKPVAVGFGIKSLKDAQEVLSVADGFIVGSAFVDLIAKGGSLKELENLARNLKPK